MKMPLGCGQRPARTVRTTQTWRGPFGEVSTALRVRWTLKESGRGPTCVAPSASCRTHRSPTTDPRGPARRRVGGPVIAAARFPRACPGPGPPAAVALLPHRAGRRSHPGVPRCPRACRSGGREGLHEGRTRRSAGGPAPPRGTVRGARCSPGQVVPGRVHARRASQAGPGCPVRLHQDQSPHAAPGAPASRRSISDMA